ncbi:MAG: transcription termination factor NusA [Anaerolineae bacterium]
MKSEFEIAITQLSSDRNLSADVILEAIEAALVSAYKRNYGPNQNISVTLDPRTGQARVFVKKEVVEEVTDDHMEMTLAEARTHKPDAVLGNFVDIELTPRNFGRIAAQTAKQVIMQRIREAERDSVYLEYVERAGEIVNGVVRNVDARSQNVTLSLGKAEAILPKSEQIPGEHYRFGQRLRVYVVEVERTGHGPQITVSRAHRGLLRRLLELEVPEIFSGTVEIKSIAREAGFRSKVAVAALQPGVDPVGSCVGMRGVRIQNIVNELDGEKIDVVAWSPSIETYIGSALSPAKVVSVYLNEEDKTAKVVVPDKALSLAIGKEGQNARLAAKLTGWRIDIRSESEAAEEDERTAAVMQEAAQRAEELEGARLAAAELLGEAQASLDDDYLSSVEVETAVEDLVLPEEAVAESVESQAEAPYVASELITDETLVEEVAPLEEPLEFAGEATVEGEAAEAIVADSDVEIGEDTEVSAEEYVEPDAEGEESESDRKKRTKKGRQRVLEFDERLGRVVAHRKRKPNRQQNVWEGDDE